MNNLKKLKILAAVLAFTSFASTALLAYVLYQNFWWKLSVDFVADKAGTSEAMTIFRMGHLTLYEINPTNENNNVHSSGRFDGPFEVWLDEYHPEMPGPWLYSQTRMNKAYNAQMHYMYEHPLKFKADIRDKQGPTNSSAQ